MRSPTPLRIEPVTPWFDEGPWPMVFDISAGVTEDNDRLRQELDKSLNRQRKAIADVLAQYHVPLAHGA